MKSHMQTVVCKEEEEEEKQYTAFLNQIITIYFVKIVVK